VERVIVKVVPVDHVPVADVSYATGSIENELGTVKVRVLLELLNDQVVDGVRWL